MSFPLITSSPTLSKPTLGCSLPCNEEANAQPRTANCSKCSASQSTFAPKSQPGGQAAFLVGQGMSDCGAVDSFLRLEHIARNCHQRRRIAGADRNIGGAGLDRFERHAHRRALLGSERSGQRVAHFHDLLGVDDLDALAYARICRPSLKLGLDLRRAPNQYQIGIGLPPGKRKRGRNRYRKTVVPAHAINCDADRHRACIIGAESSAISIIMRAFTGPTAVNTGTGRCAQRGLSMLIRRTW